jgi:hypothetical protein
MLIERAVEQAVICGAEVTVPPPTPRNWSAPEAPPPSSATESISIAPY